MQPQVDENTSELNDKHLQPSSNVQGAEIRQLSNCRGNRPRQFLYGNVTGEIRVRIEEESHLGPRTHSPVTLPATQSNPSPTHSDNTLNRGHTVELHPARRQTGC
jgi:hypothetical protein